MSAFLYGIYIGFKIDIRNKGMLLTYYLIPIIFAAFMGGIFTSINPESVSTITQTLVIFGVSMGAFLGTPLPLLELFSSDIKKTYIVSKIPLWTLVLNNFISAFIHLSIVSIIITIITPLAFGAKIPENIGAYILGFVLLLLACLSIGTVLGLLVKKTAKLTILSQILFLPSIMLSGIMFPNSMLPKLLQDIAKIFPATWGFEMMQGNAINFSNVLPAIITIIVCLMISIWKISRLRID